MCNEKNVYNTINKSIKTVKRTMNHYRITYHLMQVNSRL